MDCGMWYSIFIDIMIATVQTVKTAVETAVNRLIDKGALANR
jgi:hypothetical protein